MFYDKHDKKHQFNVCIVVAECCKTGLLSISDFTFIALNTCWTFVQPNIYYVFLHILFVHVYVSYALYFFITGSCLNFFCMLHEVCYFCHKIALPNINWYLNLAKVLHTRNIYIHTWSWEVYHRYIVKHLFKDQQLLNCCCGEDYMYMYVMYGIHITV